MLSGAVAAGSLLLTGLLALVLCFFYLKDGPKFVPWVAGLVGPRAAPHVAAVAQRSWATLSGFIKAQAAVGLVDAIFIGVGLVVLGVPLALPLAVLVFFGAFIPIIGAVFTGALAALVALVTSGPTSALIVIVLVLVVQQLEGNVLQPILVGRTLDAAPGCRHPRRHRRRHAGRHHGRLPRRPGGRRRGRHHPLRPPAARRARAGARLAPRGRRPAERGGRAQLTPALHRTPATAVPGPADRATVVRCPPLPSPASPAPARSSPSCRSSAGSCPPTASCWCRCADRGSASG